MIGSPRAASHRSARSSGGAIVARLAARQWMTGVAVLALGPPVDAGATVQELVFVANAGSGPVTAYPALSSGAVSPAISIPNPNLPDTYWDPWGVAFDAQQSLYVQSFLSNATSFV